MGDLSHRHHRDAKEDGEPRSRAAVGVLVVERATGPDASADPDAVTVPRTQLATELEEAEELIKYAATSGVDIEDDVRRDVLAAKLASGAGWTQETASVLLAALTKLSIKMKPVSGESLRKCVLRKEAAETIKKFRNIAIGLGVIIVPFSIGAFVATTTCSAIRRDIEVANTLAVRLGSRVFLDAASSRPTGSLAPKEPRSPNDDELRDLQQFAATIRDIDRRTRWLVYFELHRMAESPAFELKPPPFDLANETGRAIGSYQEVRLTAQGVEEAVSMTFGALTICLLPTLYALLGACAYLIRLFEGQIKARTFTGADRPTARLLIAAIGGLVVGLFSDFGTGQGTALSPLALAFLVGYGVDVFFYFLDGLLQTFGRPQTAPPAASRVAQ